MMESNGIIKEWEGKKISDCQMLDSILNSLESEFEEEYGDVSNISKDEVLRTLKKQYTEFGAVNSREIYICNKNKYNDILSILANEETFLENLNSMIEEE